MDVKEELKFLWKFKKNGGVGGGERSGLGVRVDVNEELKFLGNFTKKNGGCSGGLVGGSGWM